MHQIQANTYTVEIGSILESSLSKHLNNNENKKYDHYIILVDENTEKHCLAYLLTHFDKLSDAEVFTIPSGEANKTLEICAQIWSAFQEYNITRNALLLNLGGGVITDMGGFIASIYKRGIDFINIPTTLLSMVDASVGGKTGIDFNGVKNDLGLFSYPQFVICDPIFLSTLPNEEFLSGKAEMLKHGIIHSKEYWQVAKKTTPQTINSELIFKSVEIKNDIVENDPKEKGERKKLNMGHTIGHAVESFLLQKGSSLPHGNCVAWGMVTEAYLSHQQDRLSSAIYEEIKLTIEVCYPPIELDEAEIDQLLHWMKNDKKNRNGFINFNLIKDFGVIEIDHYYSEEEIRNALKTTLCI